MPTRLTCCHLGKRHRSHVPVAKPTTRTSHEQTLAQKLRCGLEQCGTTSRGLQLIIEFTTFSACQGLASQLSSQTACTLCTLGANSTYVEVSWSTAPITTFEGLHKTISTKNGKSLTPENECDIFILHNESGCFYWWYDFINKGK